ncbi:hypothetical protein [Roseomonas sp. WA12]
MAEIISWRWDYSLGVNNIPHLIDGIYLEHRDLELSAWMIRPVAQQGEQFDITITPDFNLDVRRISGDPPRDVAILQRSRRQSEVILRIPPDALALLLMAFSAGHLKYLTLTSDPPVQGSSIITGWDLRRDYDPGDLPAEKLDRPPRAARRVAGQAREANRR